QYVHASKIYEENVHVPLILINPRLFNGEESRVIAGLIDIAPTVLHLLDVPIPGKWQGRSLFSEDRSPRVYFFSPWSDSLFGYREGDRNFIFNATADEFEVYDLLDDPEEAINLAESVDTEVVLQRLAAWVQYQNSLAERLTEATGTR
ncbi:MAG: hypothetical protein V3T07_05130, partial [Myxococcota bacterium]